MKKFKIGVFGLDRGQFVLMCENLISEQMEVTAVLETNQKLLESLRSKNILTDKVKVYEDFDEFINSGIEAVVLCNYFPDHAKYAIPCMEKGIAILSETTAAPSLGECVQLVEAYEKTKTKYMLGANCLYFRAVQAMKKIIDEKKYGDIIYADAEYCHPLPRNTEVDIPGWSKTIDKTNLHWRKTLPCCYYNMHDLGPMMYITNSMPKKVSGKAVCVENSDPNATESILNHAKAFALVEMDNGSVINYSGCTGVGSLGKWYRIACRYGTVESVRYNHAEDKIIECEFNNPTTHELTWSGSGAVTPEEEVLFGGNSEYFEQRTHGGIDLILLIRFLRYLRDEEQPFFDVYRSVALSATGIMAWYSMLLDNRQLDIPDFKNPADRDKVRNDFRNPFAKNYDDLTLPCVVGEKFEL